MLKLVSLISGLALASTLSAQVEPRAGHWKTWVITSGSALRLPAPPDVAAPLRKYNGSSRDPVLARVASTTKVSPNLNRRLRMGIRERDQDRFHSGIDQ
jgi:hypothetical protein